jgi:hypothetical protein
VERRVRALLERLRDTPPRPTPKPASGPPRQAIYIYSDLPYCLAAGGSVGHVAGVLNHLEELTSSPPIFLTTTIVPTISTSVRVERFTPRGPWERHERLALRLNEEMIEWAKSCVEGVDAAFVYHRLAVNSLAGLALSRALEAPLCARVQRLGGLGAPALGPPSFAVRRSPRRSRTRTCAARTWSLP